MRLLCLFLLAFQAAAARGEGSSRSEGITARLAEWAKCLQPAPYSTHFVQPLGRRGNDWMSRSYLVFTPTLLEASKPGLYLVLDGQPYRISLPNRGKGTFYHQFVWGSETVYFYYNFGSSSGDDSSLYGSGFAKPVSKFTYTPVAGTQVNSDEVLSVIHGAIERIEEKIVGGLDSARAKTEKAITPEVEKAAKDDGMEWAILFLKHSHRMAGHYVKDLNQCLARVNDPSGRVLLERLLAGLKRLSE